MKRRILVVDDNLASLRQIGVQLGTDYEVLLAKSGASALQICLRERPDLILLDVKMPDMDGFETICRLKQNPLLGNIPVIFLTGSYATETEVKGLALGARDFITKPVSKSILRHRIDLHLRFTAYQAHLETKVMALSDNVALTIAEMIEFRDKSTGGHVARSSKYVGILGKVLIEKGYFQKELNEDHLKTMVRAASLHDIGKIAISDRILLKPERLNEEEFATMKQHTVMGAVILERLYARTPAQRYLQYAKVIALSHHERYDGQGYPYSLAGEISPLSGRIMAVADVYDALVNDRVYRKRMNHSEAYRTIVKGKGTQFDPRVVEAFEAVNDDPAKSAATGDKFLRRWGADFT